MEIMACLMGEGRVRKGEKSSNFVLDWVEFYFVDGDSPMEHNALFVCGEN